MSNNIEEDKEVNIVDVEYKNLLGQDEYIYKISDVSNILQEPQSTIRFWCKEFEAFLKVKREGRNRIFCADDIGMLKVIKALLREDDLSIPDVKKRLSKDLELIENDIQQQQLAKMTQAIAQSILKEMGSQLTKQVTTQVSEELLKHRKAMVEYRKDLLDEVSVTIENQIQNSIKADLVAYTGKIESLEGNLSSKTESSLEKHLEAFEQTMDKLEKMFLEKDTKNIENLRKSMEYNKKIYEELKDSKDKKNKGFFKRIWGKLE